MMTTDLLSRSMGDTSPADFERECASSLLHALQPAPSHIFDSARANNNSQHETTIAHHGGVNALVVDHFDGRYLLSGGAHGPISLWDLDAYKTTENDQVVHHPSSTIEKQAGGHAFGVTGLSFYPFDNGAFLSSSYDTTLKLFDAVTMSLSTSFALPSSVYAHAISPIASHLLVACGTKHPAVRLADLNTGTATHTLVGHSSGAVFAVAWSPRREHILASAGSDGTVRVWDVRRSSGSLGVFDMEDSIGIAGHDGLGRVVRRRERGRAHLGPANGLTWTSNGAHLVSAGHDARIRVWDTAKGANTLANFGPTIKNDYLSGLSIVLVPQRFTKPFQDVLFYPNGKELLMFETFEGTLIKRLRPIGADLARSASHNATPNRVISLAWRPHNIQLFSGHSDGTIRTWLPRTTADAMAEESDASDDGPDPVQRDNKRHKPNVFNAIDEQMHRPTPTFV